MNLREAAKLLEPLWRKPRAKSGPTTHDYTLKTIGHDICWSERGIIGGGAQLHAQGWGMGIEQGDFLILRNGDGTTRYQVEKVEYYRDPADMFSVELRFAPRVVEFVP